MTKHKKTYHKKYFALFVFLLMSLISFAQEEVKVKELISKLKAKDISPSELLQTKVDIANYYVYHSLDTAEIYIEEVLNYPDYISVLPKNYHRHYLVRGWIYHGNQKLEDAKKYVHKAYDIVSLTDDRTSKLELWMNLGALYQQSKDPNAMAFVNQFMTELDTTKSEADKIGWVLALQYKSKIYGGQKDYNKAFELLMDAGKLSFLHEIPKYSLGVFKSMSIFLSEIGNFEMSKAYLKKALGISRLYDYEKKMLHLELAKLYLKENKFDALGKELGVVKSFGAMSESECHDYNNIYAKFYLKKAKAKEALAYMNQANDCTKEMQSDFVRLGDILLEAKIKTKLGDYSNSQQLLTRAEKIINSKPNLNTIDIEAQIKRLAFSNELGLKDRKLFNRFNDYSEVERKNVEISSDKKLKELTIQYDIEKKENEIELLRQHALLDQQTIRYQRIRQYLSYGALLGLIVLALLLYQNNRLRNKNNELLKAEKGELIFKNEELQIVNNQLQADIKTIKESELNKQHKKYEIKVLDKTYLEEFENIMHVQSENDGCRFYLKNGEKIWSDTIFRKTLESLPSDMFIQIFRGIIVNKLFIKWINHQNLALQNGTLLKISRTYKKNLEGIKK